MDEGFGNSGELLKQQVRIAGILMPEGTFSMEDVYQINDNIVNKELIAPYIPDTLYVSELLSSFDDTTLKSVYLKNMRYNNNSVCQHGSYTGC